jgi:hypothetical protein
MELAEMELRLAEMETGCDGAEELAESLSRVEYLLQINDFDQKNASRRNLSVPFDETWEPDPCLGSLFGALSDEPSPTGQKKSIKNGSHRSQKPLLLPSKSSKNQ